MIVPLKNKTIRNARQLATYSIQHLKMPVFIALQPDCPESFFIPCCPAVVLHANLTAGRDINITASGAGEQSDLLIQGSKVSAARNLTLPDAELAATGGLQ
jgi:hypothetical protein